MKRPIISERMFLYWTDHEHPNTCRMTVRMQDAIELTILLFLAQKVVSHAE